jgi:hypothetical protein
MADADQDFMLNAIHAELQETNKLLRLVAEQLASFNTETFDAFRKYDQGRG